MASFDLPRQPLSDDFGFDRGTPVDRRYIEAFLLERRRLVRGSVLEVQDNTYTSTFGDGDVTESVVVDIDPANREATVVADLEHPGSLPPESFDCIILTQVLHLLRRPEQCILNCLSALRPGGALLATAPSVSRISPTYPEGDFWRFTPPGLRELFERSWSGKVTVVGFGNLRTCIAFLNGEVVEDMSVETIDDHDPRFPHRCRGGEKGRIRGARPETSGPVIDNVRPSPTANRPRTAPVQRAQTPAAEGRAATDRGTFDGRRGVTPHRTVGGRDPGHPARGITPVPALSR